MGKGPELVLSARLEAAEELPEELHAAALRLSWAAGGAGRGDVYEVLSRAKREQLGLIICALLASDPSCQSTRRSAWNLTSNTRSPA